MLVLKRRNGQWIEVTHTASGQVLRFRVYNISCDYPGRVNLAFDDEERNFEIQRPDRFLKGDMTPAALENQRQTQE